jgi:hypothetical protein
MSADSGTEKSVRMTACRALFVTRWLREIAALWGSKSTVEYGNVFTEMGSS